MHLRTHELAAAVGLPSPNVKPMAVSIREHGLREPIVLYQGKILDGRVRYHAIMTLALSRFELSDEHFTVFTGTWQQAADFVREKFLDTIDTRFPDCSRPDRDRCYRNTLEKLDAIAANPLPDPPPHELPDIAPSAASLMAAFDTLERRALAFLAADLDAHRRGRRPKAHDRILDVITRAHDLATTITDVQIRAFLEADREK